MARNHVIDPTYFYDAIAEFAFDYEIYVRIKEEVDERGIQVNTFSKQNINGSLQIDRRTRTHSKDGTKTSIRYNFYCKSLYRINIGDFIHYDNLWLYVDAIHDYDEWGVRSASLVAVELESYQDLSDYIDFLNGGKIV